ncbi:U5 small nuclear ribonucleoprotein TSSC4-like [Lytechinus pictus]|uniref:U5 small nuclear ribonucleoprotein TSSC4-like n=1 Tax=Lytechinus pictus TaxID=7653 RepID=UPI0030B9F352
MSSFTLNTGHGQSLSGFTNRTSDVFGSLGGLEKNYDEAVKERGPDEFLDEDRESPEREFKKPAPPRHDSGRGQREHGHDGGRRGWDRPHSRGRGGRSSYREGQRRQQKTPDYKMHPERWTEYSLEDTDVSGESANKRAAVDFFRDLRKRKAEEQREQAWDADLYTGKLEYKKPVLKSNTEQSDQTDKKQSYGDVHKMAEFQFGQSKPKVRKLPSERASSSQGSGSSISDSISLGHLGEEEDGSQSEGSIKETDQSCDSSIKIIQSDSSKTVGNDAEDGDELKEATGDGRGKTEKPVFQRKTGKGKRHIRGRKTTDENDD